MDDLDDLLTEQEAREQEGLTPSQPTTGAALGGAVLEAIHHSLVTLGGEMPNFADMDHDQRAAMIRQLEQVRAVEGAARSRRKALEMAIVRAAIDLDARELRATDRKVRLEPPNPGYDTKDMSMRQALAELIPRGDLTLAELNAAVPETISAKADHRKVNALRKRGGRVREVIDANRTRRPVDMVGAKVHINRKGGQ